uniref:Uncharacterized protein n=1 Tax=Klebsiella quasipneumoniae TaxID=1463165 RepID=A0A6B7PYS9_9ENTR|nr:hypothetical protein [Klebsiella quasipneumoniae]
MNKTKGCLIANFATVPIKLVMEKTGISRATYFRLKKLGPGS